MICGALQAWAHAHGLQLQFILKDGPFESRDRADYALDVAWEAPDSGD